MITTKWFEDEINLEDAHYIRRKVFIEEQNVPEHLEINDTDKGAYHLVIYDKKPIATGRIILKNNKAYLGRIAVLKEFRKKNYGDFVVRLLIRKAFELGYNEQYLHAQTYAKKFYEKLGFKSFGEEFIEDGILHIEMSRAGDILGNCN